MLLMCHIICWTPSFDTSPTALGFHCCCWLWRKQVWLQMGMRDRRQHLPPTLPQGTIQGRSSWRSLCLFVAITVCETPSGEESDKHPSLPPTTWDVCKGKKLRVFFSKRVHFKSHSQFANRRSVYFALNQYLAAQTEGLTGTKYNSEVSTQLKTLLILYFLEISFWMLKEIAAKRMSAPMAGYSYIHPMARSSSNISLLFMVQEWDLTMLTVTTH